MKKFLTFKFFEWAVVAASVLLLSTAYALSADIPHFDTYVNDYAHVLNDSYRHQLNERLHKFELSSPGHAQVVVAIVPNTGDESIEEFSNKAFHNNKLGHAGNNNGVLTVISMDHKMRIETGYDLEPVLTDSKVHDILDSMKPALKAGNFQAAFDTEMSSLLPLVSAGSAENAPASVSASPSPQTHSTKGFPFMGTLLLLAIIIGAIFYFYRKNGTKPKVTTTDETLSTPRYNRTPVQSPDYTRSQPRTSTYNRPTYTPPRPNTYRSGPFVSQPDPYVPPTPAQPTNDTSSVLKSAAAGGLAGFAASELLNSRKRDDDAPSWSPSSDSYSSSSSSSSSDSSSSWSSSSDSGFSGGGGDSGGGGGSDSW